MLLLHRVGTVSSCVTRGDCRIVMRNPNAKNEGEAGIPPGSLPDGSFCAPLGSTESMLKCRWHVGYRRAGWMDEGRGFPQSWHWTCSKFGTNLLQFLYLFCYSYPV